MRDLPLTNNEDVTNLDDRGVIPATEVTSWSSHVKEILLLLTPNVSRSPRSLLQQDADAITAICDNLEQRVDPCWGCFARRGI